MGLAYLDRLGGEIDDVVRDGEEVDGEALDLNAEHGLGAVDIVDNDLGIVSPTAGRKEIVVVKKFHVHHSIIVDSFDDVDALQSVVVPDVDRGLVPILARGNQVGRRDC